MYLAAIYEEAELRESATCKDFLQVRQEGTRDVRRALRSAIDALYGAGFPDRDNPPGLPLPDA
jgi:hypothetical protein